MSVEIKKASEGSQGAGSAATAPAGAAEGGAAQGSSGSESTEGTPSPGESEEGESSEGGESSAEGEGEQAKPAYKPREKFKVMDAEHAVPDYLKPLMKDADSEKQVIELLEKAFGLEPVKADREKVRKDRDTFKTQLTSVTQQVQDLRATYQRGDLDMFFDKLAIPHERVLQWALDKVNYSQLPPEQQRVIDERQAAQRRAYEAEQRLQTTSQQNDESTRRAKAMLLDASLARPDVSAFQQAYDTKVGKPGAFRDKVIAAGDVAWAQSNGQVDLTPEQAIQVVMAEWGPFIQLQPTPTPQVGQGAPNGQAGQAAPQAKTTVIPNVQGKQQSPLKAPPKNLNELRQRRDQMLKG